SLHAPGDRPTRAGAGRRDGGLIVSDETRKEKQTVLVVDDVVENCALVSDYLENVGCEVITANSGAEALAAMDRSPADLVLLDVEMPGMNGLEVCRRIKAADAKILVPVVSVPADSAF